MPPPEDIYWIVDEGGNVLRNHSTYDGEYEIGDRLEDDNGKTRRIVEKVREEDHPEVVWVKTVIEPAQG